MDEIRSLFFTQSYGMGQNFKHLVFFLNMAFENCKEIWTSLRNLENKYLLRCF